jgi:hypothetical protein
MEKMIVALSVMNLVYLDILAKLIERQSPDPEIAKSLEETSISKDHLINAIDKYFESENEKFPWE